MAEALVGLAFLWFFVMFSYLVVAPQGHFVEGWSNGFFLFVSMSALSFIAFACVAVYAELEYRSVSFEFRDSELVYERGILTRRRMTIPYEKIREIRVIRSGIHLLEQLFGLATIKVEVSDPLLKDISIPGVSHPEEAVRQLTLRVSGKKPLEEKSVEERMSGILTEMLSELRAIRGAVEKNAVEEAFSNDPASPPGLKDYASHNKEAEAALDSDSSSLEDIVSRLKKKKKDE